MAVKRDLVLGYCPTGNGDSIGPFGDVFAKKKNIRDGIDGCDAVVFWGGTDIHPSIYNSKAHPMNQAGPMLSDRDIFELQAMTYCKANGIPMIGVCRGAQLMCAFAGGTLAQHVSGHNRDHKITVEMMPNVLKTVVTTSAHHQMMNPTGTDHKVIGWATNRQSNYYQGDAYLAEIDEMWDREEPEIVYFPGLKGLAIQGHPEWVAITNDFATTCNALVRQYLLEEQTVEA